MKKILVFVFLLLSGLLGCATIPKEQREAIAAECAGDSQCIVAAEAKVIEQIEYDRAAARSEERDKIRQFIISCRAASMVVVHTQRGPSDAHRPYSNRSNEIYIPRHARLHEYQCARASDIQEALRRYGY